MVSHAELLAKIDPAATIDQETYLAPYKALQAVIELHKRDVRGNCDICSWVSGGFVVYEVCPTIQAIEKALT